MAVFFLPFYQLKNNVYSLLAPSQSVLPHLITVKSSRTPTYNNISDHSLSPLICNNIALFAPLYLFFVSFYCFLIMIHYF